jgi:uncharacterized lipoprotein YmbA
MRKLSRRVIIVCMLMTGLQTGCSSSPPSRLYLLEPMIAEPAGSGTELTVAIARVTLPEHLKREEILTQDQRYRINTAGFDRWAEPLDYNIGSVLAENLSLLIPGGRVIAYPWDTALSADYSVHLRVISFNAAPSGNIELSTSWVIFDPASTPLRVGETRYQVTPKTGDMIATVAAMSRAVERLSQDMAVAIKSLDNASNGRVSVAQMDLPGSFLEKHLAMHRQSVRSFVSYQPLAEAGSCSTHHL